MKNARILLCVLLFASLTRLSAQVTVEILTDQDEFLPGEAIPVIAKVTNRSGQTLTFGKDENWLKFAIQAHEGYVTMRQTDVPIEGEFTLQTSEFAKVRVNLTPLFQLDKAGHYKVTATVAIPQWKQQFTSGAKDVNVITGARIWQQEFGMPKAAGNTNPAPDLRIYALQEANYLRNHLTLYAQVTDSAGKFNSVVAIGPMISFGQPDAKVDKFSHLHVLYQDGPRSFNYTVINPNCEVIARQTYDYTTRPRMVADDEGTIKVAGGARRVTHDDIPAPASPAEKDVSAPTNP